MALTETVIEGTLQPDGSLLLDQKPTLLPGRVTVVLRQELEITLPTDDPFWQRMQAIWDAQNAAGHVPRTAEQIEADQREMRQEWDARQDEIELIQMESTRSRRSPGAGTP
jgi:hypothetical protein